MYPAYQMSDCSDDNLKFTVQTGVNHIVVAVHKPFMEEGQDYWTTDKLVAFRECAESHGIKVEVMALPMSSSFVDRAENPVSCLPMPQGSATSTISSGVFRQRARLASRA